MRPQRKHVQALVILLTLLAQQVAVETIQLSQDNATASIPVCVAPSGLSNEDTKTPALEEACGMVKWILKAGFNCPLNFNCTCENVETIVKKWGLMKDLSGNFNLSNICSTIDEVDKETTNDSDTSVLFAYAAMDTAASSIGLVANALVLVVLLKQQGIEHLRYYKRVLALLALSDFMFCLVTLPQAVQWFFSPDEWILGQFMCKVNEGCREMFSRISIGFILVITVERYNGIIVSTFYGGLGRWKMTALLGSIMLIAIGSVIPLFLYSEVKAPLNWCRIQWPNKLGREDDRKYSLFSLVYYSLHFLVIAVLYGRITCFLQSREFDALGDEVKERRMKESRRTSIVLIMSVVLFFIFVVPYWIGIFTLDMLASHPNSEEYVGTNISAAMYHTLHKYAKFLFPVHACINPVVYWGIDREFRRKTFQLVTSCCGKRNRSLRKSLNSGTQTTMVSTPRLRTATNMSNIEQGNTSF